ncbi:hypothetical protein PC116_g32730 [Phytophthora cactorum]|nr:hypothetical protein PC116_g32730 [Phytophthora cactorum]
MNTQALLSEVIPHQLQLLEVGFKVVDTAYYHQYMASELIGSLNSR